MKEGERRRKPSLRLGRGQGQHSALGIPWRGDGERMWGCQVGRVLVEAGRGRLPHPHCLYPAPVSTCEGQSCPVPGQGRAPLPQKPPKQYPHPPKIIIMSPNATQHTPSIPEKHGASAAQGEGQGREERGPSAQVAMVTGCKSASFLRLPHIAWMGAGSMDE